MVWKVVNGRDTSPNQRMINNDRNGISSASVMYSVTVAVRVGRTMSRTLDLHPNVHLFSGLGILVLAYVGSSAALMALEKSLLRPGMLLTKTFSAQNICALMF